MKLICLGVLMGMMGCAVALATEDCPPNNKPGSDTGESMPETVIRAKTNGSGTPHVNDAIKGSTQVGSSK